MNQEGYKTRKMNQGGYKTSFPSIDGDIFVKYFPPHHSYDVYITQNLSQGIKQPLSLANIFLSKVVHTIYPNNHNLQLWLKWPTF